MAFPANDTGRRRRREFDDMTNDNFSEVNTKRMRLEARDLDNNVLACAPVRAIELPPENDTQSVDSNESDNQYDGDDELVNNMEIDIEMESDHSDRTHPDSGIDTEMEDDDKENNPPAMHPRSQLAIVQYYPPHHYPMSQIPLIHQDGAARPQPSLQQQSPYRYDTSPFARYLY